MPAETPSGLAWQDDPELDLGWHVRAVGPDRPVDGDELRRIVADTMTIPLDRSRPLWALQVVPRMAGGRWALVWKVHHCLADGMAVMRAGSRLLWVDERAQTDGLRRPVARQTPGASAQMVAGARLARVAGYRGLFLREFRRLHELSPLAGDVGSQRAVAFTRCALGELHDLGKAVGPDVTVNDVLLAVVAGTIRHWTRLRGLSPAPIKAMVPVSMPSGRDDAASGNRDSFLFVSLPLAEDDPVARVKAVTAATRLRKNRHDARAIYALRESLSHAPAPVRRALQHVAQGPHEYSLNVSNVPGPAGPVSVLGRRVDALYSLAEVAPHHGLRVAAVSMNGSLFIGLCADPQLVPGLEDLAAGIRRSVDELHERLGATPRP